ncbi:hypothetical protein BON30_10785 [Cystobacter ferrugineus]|uniref:Uncharacterized protein n=1 Tax=Cystobacter ferrugineus TaxID=83449 RepID=A0A1L9BGI9_9BACT|nr:hypothetical protein BON30_10785 [Cystobacter ferrugineus]
MLSHRTVAVLSQEGKIASANLETDSPEDALLSWRVAASRGWLSPRWRVDVPDPWQTPAHPGTDGGAH